MVNRFSEATQKRRKKGKEMYIKCQEPAVAHSRSSSHTSFEYHPLQFIKGLLQWKMLEVYLHFQNRQVSLDPRNSHPLDHPK